MRLKKIERPHPTNILSIRGFGGFKNFDLFGHAIALAFSLPSGDWGHDEGPEARPTDGDPGGERPLLLEVHRHADDGRQVDEAEPHARQQSNGDVEHGDGGGGGADHQPEGGDQGADDGDDTAAVAVDQDGGDGPRPQGHAHQNGGDEGDVATALLEVVHQLHHEDAKCVGDSIGWK